jgi:hypothetical protein
MTTFEFDVMPGGQAFKGLKTGQVNEGCTPPAHIYGNNFDWPNYTVPIVAGGGFTINVSFSSTVDVYPSVNRLIINGGADQPRLTGRGATCVWLRQAVSRLEKSRLARLVVSP